MEESLKQSEVESLIDPSDLAQFVDSDSDTDAGVKGLDLEKKNELKS